MQLLPTTASRTGWSASAFSWSSRTRPRRFARERCGASSAPTGSSVGVVGWPLTQPAPVVRGYLVSDTYHRLALTRVRHRRSLGRVSARASGGGAGGHGGGGERSAAGAAASMRSGSPARRAGRRPARTDRIYDRIAQALARTRPAQVTLDAISEPRCHRPLLPALRAAVGIRRRDRRRAAAARRRCWSGTTRSSTRRSAGRWPASARTICCSSCRATAWSRSGFAQAPDSSG